MELEIYLTRPSMSLIRIHIVSKDRIQFCNIEMPVGWLSILLVFRNAIERANIDNKSVENAVCVLRNLSYRAQEVTSKAFL